MSKPAPAPWLILLWGLSAVVFAVTETIAVADGADGSDLTRNALQVYTTLRAVCLTAGVAGMIWWNMQEHRRAVREARAEGYTEGMTMMQKLESDVRILADIVRGHVHRRSQAPAPAAVNGDGVLSLEDARLIKRIDERLKGE